MNAREKAKAILVAIIQAAGGSFNGKTRLYKAFYVAHLLHFRDHRGVLSDYPIIRMPRGPAVDEGDRLLAELRDEGLLLLSQRPVGPYLEDVFTAASKEFKALEPAELDSVRRAVEWIADKPSTELSQWTHEFSNTWEDTPDGREMNIYADLLSESEYARMKKRHQGVENLVHAVFAG